MRISSRRGLWIDGEDLRRGDGSLATVEREEAWWIEEQRVDGQAGVDWLSGDCEEGAQVWETRAIDTRRRRRGRQRVLRTRAASHDRSIREGVGKVALYSVGNCVECRG